MKSALVNAGMFRAVNLTASTEETRYYLNGIYMEPHPSGRGVLLTATDGHRLVNVYDQAGSISEPGIIALPPALLKECKTKRGDLRLLQVSDDVPAIISVKRETAESDGYAAALEGAGAVRLAVAPKACLVDGTFPDWRRVVPKPVETCTPKPAAFNPNLLATFADVAAALMDAAGERTDRGATHAITIATKSPDDPALVRVGEHPARLWRHHANAPHRRRRRHVAGLHAAGSRSAGSRRSLARPARMTDTKNPDLDIPEFLKLTAEQRADAWRRNPPRKERAAVFVDPHYQQHRAQKKAEARKRLAGFLAKKGKTLK